MSSPIIVTDTAIICKYSRLRGGVEQSKRQSLLSIMSVDDQVKKSDESFIHLRDRTDGLISLASTTKEDMGRSKKYTQQQNYLQGHNMLQDHLSWRERKEQERNSRQEHSGRHSSDDFEGMDHWGGHYFSSGFKKEEEEFLILDEEDKNEKNKDFYWTYKDTEFLDIATKLGKVTTINDWEEGHKLVTRKVVHLVGVYKENILSANPQMCSYNATKDYLRSLFGISLSNSDEKWFENNALCEKEGLPLPFACTVLNDLVEPYGMCISRVRIHAGLSTHADAPDWMACLGINPMAKTDSTFSNARFIDLMVQSEIDRAIAAGTPLPEDEIKAMQQKLWKHANENYRFEFHENPLRGCVLLYAMGSKGTGAQAASHASGHGHSEYFSPRCVTPDKWKASIQFARKESVVYKAVPPVSPPPRIEKKLVPWDSKIYGERIGHYRVSAFLEEAIQKHCQGKNLKDEPEEKPPNAVRTLTDSDPSLPPYVTTMSPDALTGIMIERILNKIARSVSAARISGGGNVELTTLYSELAKDVRASRFTYDERVTLCKEIGKLPGLPSNLVTNLCLFIHQQFKMI